MRCCLFYCQNTSQLDPKPFKQVIAFWFSSTKKSEGCTLESGLIPARSEKKLKSRQPLQFLYRIVVQG